MMDEIIYKGNKIVCFLSNDFQAFIINEDCEVESRYTFYSISCSKMDRQIWDTDYM